MSAHRFVGHRDDAHYAVTALHQSAQGFDGKFGRAHVYNSQFVFGHDVSFVRMKWCLDIFQEVPCSLQRVLFAYVQQAE